MGTPAARSTAMLCINVLHISPWRCRKTSSPAPDAILRDGGRLFVYGPFMRDGQHTAPSNAAFDAKLAGGEPGWGVRDVARSCTRLRKTAGLTLAEIADMPANNLVLAFARARPAELTIDDRTDINASRTRSSTSPISAISKC